MITKATEKRKMQFTVIQDVYKRQACKLGIGSHDILHGQAAQLGGVLVHRHRLAALYIGAVAVRVAEVEHIDDKGCFDAPHLHIAEHQPVNDGGVAAAAAGLDAQTAVCLLYTS